MADKKARNWSVILYPESLPIDWLDILSKTGLAIAISPLHAYDVNPDGEIKKYHYHAIICFDGPTTYGNVCKLLEPLNCPSPQICASVRGYYRYLTHEDNPEKYHYPKDEITHLNGFSISDYISSSDKMRIKQELCNLIFTKEFTEYCDFIDYVLYNTEVGFPVEYFEVASNCTIFFNSVISSQRNKLKGRNEN